MTNSPSQEQRKIEWFGAAISFVYYFSILSAYYVIRPMRDQLAVELGSTHLPWLFGATFIATLSLTPLFAWGVSRWPRKVLIPSVNVFFILCQLGFILLLKDQALLSIETVGLIFFVWVSVFNLFVVSVFWSFMSDIWSDAQACRYYPIIALGGTAGAITGPILTGLLVEKIGFAPLLAVSASLLLIAVLCIQILGKWAHLYSTHRDEANNEGPLGGGVLDGLKQIYCNPTIRIMALMMLMGDAIGTIAYVLITDYSGVTFPHDVIAQTRFAATLDLSANVIQVIVQLTLTRWLLIRYGASMVFAVWGSIVVAICLAMVFFNAPYALLIGGLPWIAVVQIATRSLSYGMIQSARETLYTLVPRDLRYKGKNAVDTVVWRAGDVVSSTCINLFRSFGVNVIGFALIWASLAAASGWMGFRLSYRLENETDKI